MPSSYTNSLRLEQQFTGENINVWGVLLNAVLTRLDDSIAGLEPIALTGNYTLTTANGTDDQARNAILKFTGTGTFTVTIPSVSKVYIVWNATTGALTVTTGGGSTVSLASGEIALIICDGSNVKPVARQDMGGNRLTNLGAPASALDAATKKYVDDTAWALSSGNLPGQSGSAGMFLTTNGNTASWSSTLTGGALTITGPAGTNRVIHYQSNGVTRFDTTLSVGAETGNNVGSNYNINRFDDSGNYIDTPISVLRPTGVVTFTQIPTVNGSNIATQAFAVAAAVAF